MSSCTRTGERQVLHNIIIWFDGTLHPWPKHEQCTGKWKFDGQFFVHGAHGHVGDNM